VQDGPLPSVGEDLLRKAELEERDFLREGVRVLVQELMELEVDQHLELRGTNGTVSDSGTRGWERLSSVCRGCATTVTSRVCCNHGRERSRHWSRWCKKPTSTGSQPDAWTI
jgi:hypothetical protein